MGLVWFVIVPLRVADHEVFPKDFLWEDRSYKLKVGLLAVIVFGLSGIQTHNDEVKVTDVLHVLDDLSKHLSISTFYVLIAGCINQYNLLILIPDAQFFILDVSPNLSYHFTCNSIA